jgi:hypothetical protein
MISSELNETATKIFPKRLVFHLFSLKNPKLTPKNASANFADFVVY